MAVKDWSTTPSANATADADEGIALSEGQAPGSLNDSMRALMAVLKEDLANSLTSNGYQKLPNGLIIQWGGVSMATDTIVSYPIPFPNGILTVVATPAYAPAANRLVSVAVFPNSTTTFTAYPRYVDSGGTVSVISMAARWIAIGY